MKKTGLEASVGDETLSVKGNSPGRAYAFFNCDAPRDEVESAMPDIRQYASTPEDLELRLYEGTSGLEVDSNLAEEIKQPGDYRIMTSEQKSRWDGQSEEMPLSDLQYVLVADSPNAIAKDAIK